jgi:hypothetical protein
MSSASATTCKEAIKGRLPEDRVLSPPCEGRKKVGAKELTGSRWKYSGAKPSATEKIKAQSANTDKHVSMDEFFRRFMRM